MVKSSIALTLLVSLLSTSAHAGMQIRLGEEVHAQVGVCPDQTTAEAVLETHAKQGIAMARTIYQAMCISAPLFITPQVVVKRVTIDGEYVKVVRSLVRMKDESQSVWYMITSLPIWGEV